MLGRVWTHSQNSFTLLPQRTGANVPPPDDLCPRPFRLMRRVMCSWSADNTDYGRQLQLHLPQQVHAHAHGSSKPCVTEVIAVCFPRQQNTTDLPWPRMTCCAGRHIWPHACISSHRTLKTPSSPTVTNFLWVVSHTSTLIIIRCLSFVLFYSLHSNYKIVISSFHRDVHVRCVLLEYYAA